MKRCESCRRFGWVTVLDIQQSNGGDDAGLAVTLVAVCCLLACQSLGISISKKQHLHNISEFWECRDSCSGQQNWWHRIHILGTLA